MPPGRQDPILANFDFAARRDREAHLIRQMYARRPIEAHAGRAVTSLLSRLPGREDRFDLWAATYDASAIQTVMHSPVHQEVMNLARGLKQHPARILDAGCGTGRLLARASEAFPDAQCVGIDLSAAMLKYCSAMPPPVRLVCARAERLPLRDDAFDLVVSTMSLLRWSDPAAGLTELGRVCAPGGTVLIADAFELGPHSCVRIGDPHRELREVFAKSGLDLRQVYSASNALTCVALLLGCKARPDGPPMVRSRLLRPVRVRRTGDRSGDHGHPAGDRRR
jgi:SAM-dependent methyltransferase